MLRRDPRYLASPSLAVDIRSPLRNLMSLMLFKYKASHFPWFSIMPYLAIYVSIACRCRVIALLFVDMIIVSSASTISSKSARTGHHGAPWAENRCKFSGATPRRFLGFGQTSRHLWHKT